MDAAIHAKFDIALGSLYETVLDPHAWPVALARTADLFEASSASMFDFDYATRRPSAFRYFGLDDGVRDRYAAYFHTIDPGREVGMASAVGAWLADEQLLDLQSPAQGEYAHDFALPSGIGWVAGWKLAGDEHGCVYLGLQRPAGQPRFGMQAKATFDRLRPHVERISRLGTQLQEAAAESDLATLCLNRARVGMVVVDDARRVHLLNDRARHLLQQHPQLKIRQGRLVGGSHAAEERLVHMVSRALREPGCGGEWPAVAGADSTLWLHVLPAAPGQPLPIPRSRLAIIVLSAPGDPGPPIELLRDYFQLSASEAELLAGLVAGLSLSEWANRRGVALTTARSQLAAVFEKTGVHSQAKLVALGSSLPQAW